MHGSKKGKVHKKIYWDNLQPWEFPHSKH